MKIKKKLLVLFYLTLAQSKPATLAAGRVRDMLVTPSKPLFESLKEFEEARKKIYEEFCDKDEDDKPIVNDNQYRFSKPENAIKQRDETTILEEEEVELSIVYPEIVKALIESTGYEPKVGETETIDEILALIK